MAGIGVITNPKAKKNLKRPWIKDALQRIIGDTGQVYETRSIDELPALAHEFIRKGIDLLAVNGGDGTTHIALTHFIPIYQSKGAPLPKLLSLRGGTMNTISNSIKHKGKGEDILSSVVRKYKAGESVETVRQPVLHINDRYGFMWGYGVVGNFLEQYYKGTVLGPWQAFKTVARIAASMFLRTSLSKQVFATYPSVLEIDGKKYDLPDCSVIMACSILEVGLGAMLTYRAYEKPGYMHIRSASLRPYQVVPWIGHLYLGKRIPDERMLDELAREAHIKIQGRPPYTIDGELYRDTDAFYLRQGPVLNVVREGTGKTLKGIGLPEGWEAHALPSGTKGEFSTRSYKQVESERAITL